MPKKPMPKPEPDLRTKIDLPPEEAIKALLKVDPDSEPELSEEEVSEAAQPNQPNQADEG